MINLSMFPLKPNTDNVYFPNFTGRIPSSKLKTKPKKLQTEKLARVVQTPKERDPGPLYGISLFARKIFHEQASIRGISRDDLMRELLGVSAFIQRVLPEPSKSVNIGKTKVTSLIDGGQIFAKTKEFIKSAKKSIQVEMFEFQNQKVDGDIWPHSGAKMVPGFQDQQDLLDMLIKKKREVPHIKIQVILDAHKWYINGNGEKVRHYNNQAMIKHLKENGIDVVPYPRAAQQGTALQHVKLMIVDGQKAIIGGMNWGTHSCANHDACVAIETLPKYKHSEVDNIMAEIFNPDWKFAWQRLGATKIIAGPLTKEDQKHFSGIRKEIKPENVTYMDVVGKLFDNPDDLNRYKEGRLDLIEPKPVSDPKIKILVTKPKELEIIGEEGKETTRKYLEEKLKTSKKVRGELFVLSDKEMVELIVDRHKKGELDAQFIVSPDILEEFAYCRNAYETMVSNGVPVRMYNVDERINQRMHGKWAVFDDKELMIGSTNWSGMGLNSNPKKGYREDYEKHSEKINKQIVSLMKSVKEHEDTIGLPPLLETPLNYQQLLQRRAILKHAINDLNNNGATQLSIDGKVLNLMDEQKSTLRTIQGYYKNIKNRSNAKEKYKRGNNECAVAFESPSLARVFLKQFGKDWDHSKLEYDELKQKIMPLVTRSVGNTINYEG